MQELFAKYNELIKRHDKAIAYFEENPQLVDKHIEKYKEIVSELDTLIRNFRLLGYVMTNEQILNGFKEA